MNLYIADLHFGHRNIIKLDHRPFLDAGEMDDALIKLWNARVSPNDNVYIIGDFAYKSDKDEAWYLQRLKGHKHLVLGNHDGKLLKNERAMSYFETVDNMMQVTEDEEQIVLCHYPMAEWYKSRHGTWLIYGHIHGTRDNTYEYMKTLDHSLNAAACINNYAPASFNELKKNNQRFQEAESAKSSDIRLLRTLQDMKASPDKYYKGENRFEYLRSFLSGYTLAVSENDGGLAGADFQTDIDRIMEDIATGEQLTEHGLFDLYIDTFLEEAKKRYPGNLI